MASKKIRLFKIASEINISKDEIFDFLISKGYDIQNKPTSMLDEEMVESVYQKFKKEKLAVEKQREKLEKVKSPKRPEAPSKASYDEANEEPVESQQKASKAKEPEHVSTADSIHEVKILGKIDLDQFNKKPEDTKAKADKGQSQKPTAKTKQAEPSEIVIEADTDKQSIIQEEIPVVEQELPMAIALDESPTEDKVVEDKPSAKDVETASKVEEFKEMDEASLIESKLTEANEPEAEEIVDINTETEIVDNDSSESSFVEEEHLRVKKKKKSATVAEVELDIDDSSKLKGLTIVGKIDLKSDKDKEIAKVKKKRIKGKIVEDDEEDSVKTKEKKKLKLKKKLPEPAPEPVSVVKKKRKKKVSIREQITQGDVDKAIRKTLAGMGETSQSGKRAQMRHKKKAEREEKELRKQEELELDSTILRITEYATTSDLANLMGTTANEIILKCMALGLMVSINQRLDKDTITLIADDYGYQVEFLDEKSMQAIEAEEEDDSDDDNLEPRSPIVTIMGHVDHGKTSLLDFIRNTSVVAGEAGGITQHIGAYRVEIANNKSITFLDTPGHEAFTAMRARGAQVTDIVVLVVAADDSVMPQTIEAISHAQAAKVPIIVAINKMDKPDANPDRIKQQLADQNVLVEEWGGRYQSVQLSAKTGMNVDTLLDKILLEAELLDLKANPNRKSRGVVVEANMDKGLGTVSTVIIQKGTLRIGDPFVAGVYFGRIRAMFDERGNKLDEVPPSHPARIVGFHGLPEAGDFLVVVDSDNEAKIIANERQQIKREQNLRQVRHATLDDISKQIAIGGVKELYLVIKADVSGSVEALSDSLLKQSTEEVKVVILYKGVGNITESDVNLAVASHAVIIGFNVSSTASARKIAENESVDIRLYSIIYDAINEIRLALEGLLTPDVQEEVTGSVEVRKVFKISKLGNIAGCIVQSGKIRRNDRIRVLREGLLVYNGTIHSLKRNKDDVREVESGYECGIMCENFNSLEEGDIIEAFKLNEIKRTL